MRRQRAAAVSADLSKLRLRRLPYTVLGVSAPSISTVHTPDRPSRAAEAREGGPYRPESERLRVCRLSRYPSSSTPAAIYSSLD